MARLTEAKCRLCRREGEKLFLKGIKCESSKCPLERRRYPPGIHGPERRGKLSVYGTQMREKQKTRRVYGLLEGQFHKVYNLAKKMKGNTGENFLSLLERRLDNVVFLLGLAPSRNASRQLVGHGHIYINAKKVDIPSYILKVGDEIKLREKAHTFPAVITTLERKATVSPWLVFDKNTFTGKIIRLPGREDISHPINEKLIVEFYSK